MDDLILFEDQLRIEGINFKGFGILPKYVMIDRDLTIEAKTIYAYFCSFAGNGDTPFPGRDKILVDLPMSKDAYYKHFKQLTEQGYISVVQQKQEAKFAQNIYTLVSNPKKFIDSPTDHSDNPNYSRICFSGLKSLGYGMIPKAVMIDFRLPVKAKGVYAYFCSYTGAGDNAFPHKDQILYHLQITEKTYYKFYKILTDLNYISAVQRHVGGRLQINDYYLNDTPNVINASKKIVLPLSTQDGKKQDTRKQDTKLQDTRKQDTKLQDTRKQDTKLQDTRKQDTNINNTNKNSININNPISVSLSLSSLLEKPSLPNELSLFNEGVSEMTSEIIRKNIESILLQNKSVPYYFSSDQRVMTEAIHVLTEWEILYPSGYSNEFEQRVYNLFNEALIEMCCCKSTMTLKGSVVSYAKIIDKINELGKFEDDSVDLSEIVEPSMANYIRGVENGEIHNPLKYMKSCIWDAMLTGNIKAYQTIQRDGLYNPRYQERINEVKHMGDDVNSKLKEYLLMHSDG